MTRRIVRGTGKALIAIGVLILLFVAYELWGTGIAEGRNQRKLKSNFHEQLTGPAPATPQPAPPPVPGEAVALIKIDKIGIEKAVVEGVGVPDLKKGPGHYPETPLPGEKGNSAIAGHRTTYGAPFYRLNELAAGDSIQVTTRAKSFEYKVRELRIVSPDEISVLDNTPDRAQLTLTTCHPRFSAAQRLIVFADLIGDVVPSAPEPEPQIRTKPVADRAGLSGDRAARGPAAAWGSLALFIWLAAWYAGYIWHRKWTAYFVAAPFFFVVLFIFYENVARLLPANV